MSEENYYGVLGVSETASQDEIKAAYRNLIKQVHPDALPQTSAYWKKIAEDKAKELTTAYQILSDTKQRASYDSLLDSHRQQSDVPTQPADHSRPGATPTPRRSVSSRGRYSWQPLKRWARKHPLLASSLAVLAVLGIFTLLPDSNRPQSSPGKTGANTGSNPVSPSSYSALPCDDQHSGVSPIDGKPCKTLAPVTPQIGGAVNSAATHSAPPTVSATPDTMTSSTVPKPGVLGISGADWEGRGEQGIEVLAIEPNSAADLAGLHVGNVITDANGRKIRSTQELTRFLAENGPGSKLRIGYLFKNYGGWMPKETIVVLTK